MAKLPIPTENSKTKGQHTNATKNFDYKTIADRLRTVSWSKNIHPTGVVILKEQGNIGLYCRLYHGFNMQLTGLRVPILPINRKSRVIKMTHI